MPTLAPPTHTHTRTCTPNPHPHPHLHHRERPPMRALLPTRLTHVRTAPRSGTQTPAPQRRCYSAALRASSAASQATLHRRHQGPSSQASSVPAHNHSRAATFSSRFCSSCCSCCCCCCRCRVCCSCCYLPGIEQTRGLRACSEDAIEQTRGLRACSEDETAGKGMRVGWAGLQVGRMGRTACG
eukprot:245979-Chlamydomonas_euryale.AAC.1